MSQPQDPTRRRHQKARATKKLAAWRLKNAEAKAAAPAAAAKKAAPAAAAKKAAAPVAAKKPAAAAPAKA